MTTKKKTNKYKSTRYPGLDKNVNLKIRWELYDQDYIDKLTEEEKLWLSNFNREYVAADFNHPGKRLHKKKIQSRKVVSTGKVRKYDIGKKAVQDANNKRNVDAFAVTKANGTLLYGNNSDVRQINTGSAKETFAGAIRNSLSENHSENLIISIIDAKNDPEVLEQILEVTKKSKNKSV